MYHNVVILKRKQLSTDRYYMKEKVIKFFDNRISDLFDEKPSSEVFVSSSGSRVYVDHKYAVEKAKEFQKKIAKSLHR